jgi:hypothetical protein
VEAVKLTGSPQIITDKFGAERDLLLYPYEGRCAKCHVIRLGGFGRYMGGSSPTPLDKVWLFNAGRLTGRP